MDRSTFSAGRPAPSFRKEKGYKISLDCPLLCTRKRVFIEDEFGVVLWTQTPYWSILRLIEGLLYTEPNSPQRFLIVCVQKPMDGLKNHLELLIIPTLHVFNLFFQLLISLYPKNISRSRMTCVSEIWAHERQT